MQHRLLILGSMGEFVQLVKKSKERGYYTIVCDNYPDGPARTFADEDYVIPVTATEEIAQLCKEKAVDGIITSFSDLLLECMVKIAAAADLPCYLKPEQLPWYRDKAAAKELLHQMQLPTPGFLRIPVKDTGLCETLASHGLCYPLVTKPLDKYGSRGIYVVHNDQELFQAIQRTSAFTDLDEILLEEYNEGYEFNLMSWVLDGQVHIISIADREKTKTQYGEIPISTRNVYPSCFYEQVAPAARQLLQDFITHTGQQDGALSMQFFWAPGKEIQVCEIAGRFFGYEHELTDIVFGLNMEDLLLNALYDREALRRQLEHHHPEAPIRHGAVLYFHGKQKKIADLSAAQKLAQHPAVIKPWIFYREGESVIAHGSNPYVALYYIAAATRKELDAITEEFFSTMEIPDSSGAELLWQNRIPIYLS